MKRLWQSWVTLLDHREPASSLAVMRMICAATVFVTLAHAWWSGVAESWWVAPEKGGIAGVNAGILRYFGGNGWPEVRVLVIVALVASALMLVGALTRAATVITWLAFHTLMNLNPWSGGSGDDVVSNALFLLMWSGCGRAWSLDARWFPGSSSVPSWPRYLAIGQLVAIYFAAGCHKMSASWLPVGSLDAVWYSLHSSVWQRRPVPVSLLLGRFAQFATLGTWLFEVSSPLLLLAFWYRLTAARAGRVRRWFNRVDYRKWYLLFGVCIHLGIELTMEVGAFFGGMLVLYAACVHPGEWRYRRGVK